LDRYRRWAANRRSRAAVARREAHGRDEDTNTWHTLGLDRQRATPLTESSGKAVRDAIVKTLHFNSETGMPQYDSIAKRVYVNLRRINEIAEIDPATDTVAGRYPVAGCEHNHGMAVDSEHHRAFLLCGGNRTFTVFALDTHKAIAHFPLPAGADVVKFDPGTGRAYAACSSGFISVFEERDADHFEKIEDFPVQKLVHSLAVDPATPRVYAPEQEEDGKPVARMVIYEPVILPQSK